MVIITFKTILNEKVGDHFAMYQWLNQNEIEEAMASPETNLLRFLLVLCINFQLLEINGSSSRTQDDVSDYDYITDCPFQNKIIDCATAQ